MGGVFKQLSGGTMCRLEINFFDRQRAWVGITAYISGIRELDIIRFFAMFLAKILFTLGKTNTANALLLNVYDYFCAMANYPLDDGSVARINVLDDNQRLVDSDEPRSASFARNSMAPMNSIAISISACLWARKTTMHRLR